MSAKTKKLTNLKVKELSLVDAGANNQEFAVFKSAAPPCEKDEDEADEAESDQKPDEEENEMDTEQIVTKALAPVLEQLAKIEAAVSPDAIQAVVAQATTTEVEKVEKAFDLHKQLIDEKVEGILTAVSALGEAIKAGVNYDDLWMPFMHISDALGKLKSDSMTLQTQMVGSEVAKSADGAKQDGQKEAILKYAAALPGIVEGVIAKAKTEIVSSEVAKIQEQIALVTKSLEGVTADIKTLVDSPAPPAATDLVTKAKPKTPAELFKGVL